MRQNNPNTKPTREPEREIKDLSKDELNGKRTPKKRKKEYDTKNSDDYGHWQ